MDADQPPSPEPATSIRPPASSYSLLRDVSNFKTPKRPLQSSSNYNTPCTGKFFTASKQTPKSSYACSNRSSIRRGQTKTKTAAARRLKSLELEQSQSAYKSHLRKEQSLKTLSKSITVWLNFLVQNPKSCGCAGSGADFVQIVGPTGKREGGEVMTWRSPKRLREMWWRGSGSECSEVEEKLFDSKYLALRNSLKEVCSFDDLKQRMGFYLSLGCCREIFDAMSLVTKVRFVNLTN